MFKRTFSKIALILVVVTVLVASVLLAACEQNAFKPGSLPDKATVEADGNGGNAVKYGEWLYYVNGYQSSAAAENTYAESYGRVGSIARIKISDMEKLFEVYEDTTLTSTSAKTKKIAEELKKTAEVVVPNFYYSGNTTTTDLNGIYIFNDRLYILTPNDALTAGGNKQTDQSVLTSYALNGSDMKKHYVFTSNAAQIMLNEIDGKLVATFVMASGSDTNVANLDMQSGELTAEVKKISNAKFDIAGKAVFFTDEDGSICKLAASATDKQVIVDNSVEEGEDKSTITYTITSVNDGTVYYTMSDSDNSDIGNKALYFASEANTEPTANVALSTETPTTYYGYKDTIIFTATEKILEKTLYGIYKTDKNTVILDPTALGSDKAITFNKLIGDTLYFTRDNIAYTLDLAAENAEPVPYARSLASASGWSVPKIIKADDTHNYVITLSGGSVSVVKFDTAEKTNSDSVILTLVADED